MDYEKKYFWAGFPLLEWEPQDATWSNKDITNFQRYISAYYECNNLKEAEIDKICNKRKKRN